jgi:hypothetical protein
MLAAENFHDAVIHAVAVGSTCRMVVRVGDRQGGYRELTIDYANAELRGSSVADLERLLSRGSEVLFCEIGDSADGRWEHRWLLWPAGEFAFRFAEARINQRSIADREHGKATAVTHSS